jgi:hypothetical protein
MSSFFIARLLMGALVLTLAVPGLAQGSFDGTWVLRRTFSANGKGAGCGPQGVDFRITIRGRVVLAPGGKGSVSPSGQIRFPGTANYFTGTVHGNTVSGTYRGVCTGTFSGSRG